MGHQTGGVFHGLRNPWVIRDQYRQAVRSDASTDGKLTEGWTDFALKGGNLL